jgi:hypothetical protein
MRPAEQVPSRPRRSPLARLVRWLALAALLAAALGALFTWATLRYTFSTGERVGYVQKFSKRGWLCKTWEGELAMVNVPGALSEKFLFTVRDDAVAAELNRTMGRRVALHYEQHVGVPTRCFGDTQYFVTRVAPSE